MLTFAALEQDRLRWHGIIMEPEIYAKAAASFEIAAIGHFNGIQQNGLPLDMCPDKDIIM